MQDTIKKTVASATENLLRGASREAEEAGGVVREQLGLGGNTDQKGAALGNTGTKKFVEELYAPSEPFDLNRIRAASEQEKSTPVNIEAIRSRLSGKPATENALQNPSDSAPQSREFRLYSQSIIENPRTGPTDDETRALKDRENERAHAEKVRLRKERMSTILSGRGRQRGRVRAQQKPSGIEITKKRE